VKHKPQDRYALLRAIEYKHKPKAQSDFHDRYYKSFGRCLLQEYWFTAEDAMAFGEGGGYGMTDERH